MKTLNTIAENNKLLNSPEKLAVYITLYTAKFRGETITINGMVERINKKFECDIDYQKARNILITLEENNVVKKKTSNDFKAIAYELTNIIFVPFNQTPIPSYQLTFLMLSTIVSSYCYLYAKDTTHFIISATSFFTISMVIVFHYVAFEMSQQQYFERFNANIYINKFMKLIKIKYNDVVSLYTNNKCE